MVELKNNNVVKNIAVISHSESNKSDHQKLPKHEKIKETVWRWNQPSKANEGSKKTEEIKKLTGMQKLSRRMWRVVTLQDERKENLDNGAANPFEEEVGDTNNSYFIKKIKPIYVKLTACIFESVNDV
jgi:hypothetical protein